VSPTQKQIKTSKVGNSEFMVLGKNSEWEPIKYLIIEKNTESTLNSEYILKNRFRIYHLKFSTMYGVESSGEKLRKEAFYHLFKNEYPLHGINKIQKHKVSRIFKYLT